MLSLPKRSKEQVNAVVDLRPQYIRYSRRFANSQAKSLTSRLTSISSLFPLLVFSTVNPTVSVQSVIHSLIIRRQYITIIKYHSSSWITVFQYSTTTASTSHIQAYIVITAAISKHTHIVLINKHVPAQLRHLPLVHQPPSPTSTHRQKDRRRPHRLPPRLHHLVRQPLSRGSRPRSIHVPRRRTHSHSG